MIFVDFGNSARFQIGDTNTKREMKKRKKMKNVTQTRTIEMQQMLGAKWSGEQLYRAFILL